MCSFLSRAQLFAVFSLGSASPLAGQGEPGLADNGPSGTIPLELPWKAHSLAEDLSRDIAEPSLSRCTMAAPGSHFGTREVGNGRRRDQQKTGKMRHGNRVRAEPLLSCTFSSQGAFRNPPALPGRCHISLWVLELLLPKALCEQRWSLCHHLSPRAALGLMSALPNEEFAPDPSF